MDIRTFAELTTPDERSLIFTPLGIGGLLTPEDATRLHQESIAAADLVPAAPSGTRDSFERLRRLHTYGVLCYDNFRGERSPHSLASSRLRDAEHCLPPARKPSPAGMAAPAA